MSPSRARNISCTSSEKVSFSAQPIDVIEYAPFFMDYFRLSSSAGVESPPYSVCVFCRSLEESHVPLRLLFDIISFPPTFLPSFVFFFFLSFMTVGLAENRFFCSSAIVITSAAELVSSEHKYAPKTEALHIHHFEGIFKPL